MTGVEPGLAVERRAGGVHWREFILLMTLGDAAIVLVALLVSVRLVDALSPDFVPTEFFQAWFAGTWILWLIALRLGGSYGLLPEDGRLRHAGSILRALTIVTLVTLVAYFFAPRSFPRSTSLVALPVVFGALLVWRGPVAARIAGSAALERRILFLGVDEATRRLGLLLASPRRAVPYVPVAFLSDRGQELRVGALDVLYGTADIWDHVRRLGVAEIATARGEQLSSKCLERLVECYQAGVAVVDAADLYEDLSGRVLMEDIGTAWYAQLPTLPRRPYFALKRVIDVVGSAIGLVVLSPVMLVIALLIFVMDGRPVLFTQERVGRRGVPFTIYKFRSMQRGAEEGGPQYAQRDDPRSTRLGRFLRPTGLDELPQLWSVLRGRMSLIGPRPERPVYAAELAKALPLYWARSLVRPGIVGWAELHVKHAANLAQHLERLEFDLYYVKRADLLLDMDIALRAIGLVLRGRR